MTRKHWKRKFLKFPEFAIKSGIHKPEITFSFSPLSFLSFSLFSLLSHLSFPPRRTLIALLHHSRSSKNTMQTPYWTVVDPYCWKTPNFWSYFPTMLQPALANNSPSTKSKCHHLLMHARLLKPLPPLYGWFWSSPPPPHQTTAGNQNIVVIDRWK